MKEVEILLHYQPRADRVKKFQDSGNEENEARKESAESLQSEE